MDFLPNEIVTSMLQYLSQKHIPVLATVCKKWNGILSRSLFFNTLHFYSIQQLKTCLQLTKETTANNVLFCNYVEHIYIHFHIDVRRNDEMIIDMLETFSNIRSLYGNIPLTSYFSFNIPPLNQLDHFYLWYNNYEDKEWIDLFTKNQHKIKLLEFELREDFLDLSPSSSSSSMPIIYYRPISSIKTMDDDFVTEMSREYRIHTIKLPILPSLTRLFINCFDIDGDECVFESIHQSCPQLVSLTLKLFKMHISDNYSHYQLSIQPNLQLRELAIGDQFYDSNCYQYLSLKYPQLTSLSLSLSSRYYSKDTHSIYRSAIFNMITQYIGLKKLTIDINYDEDLNQVWPYAELYGWLQQNPTQLNYIGYSSDFVVKLLQENGYFGQQQQQLQSSVDPTIIPSNPTLNNYNNIFFQRHDYLNHLTSLSIGNENCNAIYMFYYFYLCNGNSVFLSNTIETLSIDSGYFGNIYFCLNAFPNLKSLHISGNGTAMEINDDDEYDNFNDDNDYYNSPHLKEVLQFLKKKMELQQLAISNAEVNNKNRSNNNNNNKDHVNYYNLKKIELKLLNVHFKMNGWNGLFKRCPNLKEISLSDINSVKRVEDNESIKMPIQEATFDLSHLSLDLLKIENFNYEPVSLVYDERHYVKVLMINETSSTKSSYYIGFENKSKSVTFNYINSTTLNIICKYIDSIVFHYNQ
ncbi:unnamed protein product [Cunninghamella blakesleeana]